MSLAIMGNYYGQYDRTKDPIFQFGNCSIDTTPRILQTIFAMDAFQFERVFVQVVEEIAKKKGMNAAQLARAAWPHQKAGATAWRRMRNNEAKPKRLNIEEAALLTQAIGMSMADICGIVQGRLLELKGADTLKPNEIGSGDPPSGLPAPQKKRTSERPVLAVVQGDIG